jgi:DNA helicase HerA-like ATPase
MNEDTIQIGVRQAWGQEVPFGISLPDLRQHIYVIGKSGSGKTTLLRNMIIQHIALGHGVGLIDPHGDLAEELLNHIPRWRTDHVVYFNPSDLEFPVALNLLANVPKDERHLVASLSGRSKASGRIHGGRGWNTFYITQLPPCLIARTLPCWA